jgi:membrane-associated HD superfamily phosphohydrolase
MIVLIWLQLIIGTILFLVVYGHLVNMLQKTLKVNERSFDAFLLLTTLFLIFVYVLIAYYFSKTLDLYYQDKETSKFITVITFGILCFLLYSPAKFAETLKQKGQFFWAGTIGLTLFCIWRYYPNFAESIFSWIPIYIWK